MQDERDGLVLCQGHHEPQSDMLCSLGLTGTDAPGTVLPFCVSSEQLCIYKKLHVALKSLISQRRQAISVP